MLPFVDQIRWFDLEQLVSAPQLEGFPSQFSMMLNAQLRHRLAHQVPRDPVGANDGQAAH